ncbi:hypothetical protein [Mycobacterium shottsii]|nr:hypothetical protein [Mycobacterium shottsii]
MTTTIPLTNRRADHRARSRTALRHIGVAMAVLVLGGCSLMRPHRPEIDQPAHPLSDQQARDQVIEPAKQIASFAGLQDPTGRFDFSSCNDQGDPPYRGLVSMSFAWPTDDTGGYPAAAEPNTVFQQIATDMVAHGWSDGPPPDWHPFGRVLNKNGVVAVLTQSSASGKGSIQLYGECLNTTNHRLEGTTMGSRIDEQLRGK